MGSPYPGQAQLPGCRPRDDVVDEVLWVMSLSAPAETVILATITIPIVI